MKVWISEFQYYDILIDIVKISKQKQNLGKEQGMMSPESGVRCERYWSDVRLGFQYPNTLALTQTPDQEAFMLTPTGDSTG